MSTKQHLKNLVLLKSFLQTSFKGSTISGVKIDDCVESLDYIIKENKEYKSVSKTFWKMLTTGRR